MAQAIAESRKDLGPTNTKITLIQDSTYYIDGAMVVGQMPKTRWQEIIKSDRRSRWVKILPFSGSERCACKTASF